MNRVSVDPYYVITQRLVMNCIPTTCTTFFQVKTGYLIVISWSHLNGCITTHRTKQTKYRGWKSALILFCFTWWEETGKIARDEYASFILLIIYWFCFLHLISLPVKGQGKCNSRNFKARFALNSYCAMIHVTCLSLTASVGLVLDFVILKWS